LFDFDLPARLIAQYPAEQRDRSRLLVVNRNEESVGHHQFADLPDLLASGDLLILNDTQVVPARLLGRRERTGGKWEGLFLRQTAQGQWTMLCQTRGRLQQGEYIAVEPGPLRLQLMEKQEGGSWLVESSESGPAHLVLQQYGHVPLPPYIRKGQDDVPDRDRYQTVYARQPGAVAAPTAGLHFSDEVFSRLRQRGIDYRFVTLHVGWGTFQPLQDKDVTRHHMHHEWGELPQATVQAIEACRQRRGRVVAVGTTAVRVLETVAAFGALRPWSGETDLFIYPPYTFRAVDALVTNFHLPGTTLLLLVSAFAGVDLMRHAYETAIAEEYRFYSYGDAMLIL
jgi:S-adenosylmethionine:tRNA ribosyltransferase-isomerase